MQGCDSNAHLVISPWTESDNKMIIGLQLPEFFFFFFGTQIWNCDLCFSMSSNDVKQFCTCCPVIWLKKDRFLADLLFLSGAIQLSGAVNQSKERNGYIPYSKFTLNVWHKWIKKKNQPTSALLSETHIFENRKIQKFFLI